MKKPTVVFFGSSKYSVIAAKILNQAYPLTTIVTNPNKPKGRKKELTSAPPKEFAQKNSILILTTDELDKSFLEKIKNLDPDFIVVADYGLILPNKLLQIPKYAALNIHHSLLPKYRGPSPAPSTILAGNKTSGVTIIEMTENVDAGPIVTQKECKLKENETTDSLLIKLNTLGGKLLIDVIANYLQTGVKPLKQDESKATYTKRFTKEDGHINLFNPPNPQTLDRMIRAFYPWPGVYTKLKMKSSPRFASEAGEKLKIIKLLPSNHPTDPFAIQPEGKRPMTLKEFLNGYPLAKESIKKLIN